MCDTANAPVAGGVADADDRLATNQLSPQFTAAPPTAASPCPHPYTRPSADDDLELCNRCGRIVRALTRDGELELLRLASRCNVDELAHDGGADYTLRREPARPKLKVVPTRAAAVSKPIYEEHARELALR